MARKNLQISFNFFYQGDLWAESSFLGYKLHFYACMEGEIFDVTEWAACQVCIWFYLNQPNDQLVILHNSDGFPSCCVRIRLKVITEGWESKES